VPATKVRRHVCGTLGLTRRLTHLNYGTGVASSSPPKLPNSSSMLIVGVPGASTPNRVPMAVPEPPNRRQLGKAFKRTSIMLRPICSRVDMECAVDRRQVYGDAIYRSFNYIFGNWIEVVLTSSTCRKSDGPGR
jgi:hypothetical protein